MFLQPQEADLLYGHGALWHRCAYLTAGSVYGHGFFVLYIHIAQAWSAEPFLHEQRDTLYTMTVMFQITMHTQCFANPLGMQPWLYSEDLAGVASILQSLVVDSSCLPDIVPVASTANISAASPRTALVECQTKFLQFTKPANDIQSCTT